MGVHMGTCLPIRIASFLFTIGTLKQLSPKGGLENLENNLTDALKMGYSYWPFVMIGLYTIVPTRFGNMYYDSFNLLWMVMVSYIANRNHTHKDNLSLSLQPKPHSPYISTEEKPLTSGKELSLR